MPALPPDETLSKLENDTLSKLQKSVRQGDWSAIARLTTLLISETVPENRDALEEYLQKLRGVLVEARIGRARLALSRNRLRAAAKFTSSGTFDDRQFSVIPTKF